MRVAPSNPTIEECKLTRKRKLILLLTACAVAAASLVTAVTSAVGRPDRVKPHSRYAAAGGTYTPIKHVVVIFQENVSFDHYFGTYPTATNTDGQTFHAKAGTPAVDGLPPATSPTLPVSLRHSTNLLTTNPNEADPVRLDSSAAGKVSGQGELTCDQDHDYSDEQKAFDTGKMDLFVQSTGTGTGTGPVGNNCDAKQVMDYYDGNTVTGPVELRPELRDERRLVRDDVRTLGPGCDQPRLRRHGRGRHLARRRTAHRWRRPPRRTPTSTPTARAATRSPAMPSPTGTTARPATRWR